MDERVVLLLHPQPHLAVVADQVVVEVLTEQ
jgi:hypothetical protein